MKFEILVEIVYDNLGLTFLHAELNHVLLHYQCQNSFPRYQKFYIRKLYVKNSHKAGLRFTNIFSVQCTKKFLRNSGLLDYHYL